MITQSEVKRLFSYNRHTGILKWKIKPSARVSIGDEAGTINSQGYKQVVFNRKTYKVHVLIWLWSKGYIPEGDIDHKDRVRHHNWLSNLREISRQCNNRNCGIRKDNKSGIKGICWNKKNKKWHVSIAINKIQHFIGLFADFDEAVCHRLATEQCLDWNIVTGKQIGRAHV